MNCLKLASYRASSTGLSRGVVCAVLPLFPRLRWKMSLSERSALLKSPCLNKNNGDSSAKVHIPRVDRVPKPIATWNMPMKSA